MFSYLRPRSRHGASNVPSTPESPRGSSSVPTPDYQTRFPPPQQPPPPPPPLTNYRGNESHVSSIPSRAPVLPPIPRVASIYGTPAGYQNPGEQLNAGTSEHTQHSRVHSIEEHKVSSNIDSSPKSTSSATGNRPRSNFSRPFHGRDGSLTPSEERAYLQEIWRSAAQTAQLNETFSQQGKRPQPFVNTDLARQNAPIELSNATTLHTPRMPFQDDDPESSRSRGTFSPKETFIPGPFLGRSSEEPIRKAQQEPNSYSRQSPARPSESQSSLTTPRSREAVSPQYNQASPVTSSITTQSKPSRFTRLNPISLLTRRRSSQPSNQPETATYRRNLMLGSTLPQDYVGIRGNRVHDFSAPRPRKAVSQRTMASAGSEKSPDTTNELLHVRTVSRDDSSPGGPSPSPERTSDSPRMHTPVVVGNIEDSGKNVWRQDPEDSRTTDSLDSTHDSSSPSEYSDSESYTSSEADDTPRDPLLLGDPTFGLFSAPENVREPQEFSFIVPKHLAGPPAPPRTPRSRSQTPNQDRSPKGKSYNPPSAPRTPRSRSQTPSNQGHSPKDSRAPRSASTPPLRESRTPSPQFGNLSRQSKSNASRFSFDLAGFGSSVQEKLLEDKHRQKLSKDLRTSKISQVSVPETDDGYGSEDPDFGAGWEEEEIPGMGMDEDDFPAAKSIADFTLDSMSKQKSTAQATKPSLYTHKNIAVHTEQPEEEKKETPQPSKSFILRSNMFQSKQIQVNPGDDFYFDDGVIEDADLQIQGPFDESVFDDLSHRIGQHLPMTLAAVPEQQSQESSIPSTRPMSLESNPAAGHGPQTSNDTSRTSIPPAQPWDKTQTAKRSSMLKNDVTGPREIQTTLTQGNLAAYHDALALAAQQAAIEGRFDRNAPIDVASTDKIALQTSLDTNHSQGLPVDVSETYDDFQDRITFDDYEQEDDDVIAAANADALDYDEEFYGDEFHFYSKGDGGAGESQYGGYFLNDIKRSHSGRANGQEPSLTPITEMSEWSTRNSMVSLAVDRAYGSSVQQPGLAQIADSLKDENEDMSLSSLKRLRQNAFAGSASSLGSGGSGKNASSQSSGTQITSRTGNGETKTQAEKAHPLRNLASENDEQGPPSPLNTEIRRPFVKGHSRNSSGAESVTYVQENDAEGSRWVLERRRTTEDGSIEVLGRQVVEGGRI